MVKGLAPVSSWLLPILSEPASIPVPPNPRFGLRLSVPASGPGDGACFSRNPGPPRRRLGINPKTETADYCIWTLGSL